MPDNVSHVVRTVGVEIEIKVEGHDETWNLLTRGHVYEYVFLFGLVPSTVAMAICAQMCKTCAK